MLQRGKDSEVIVELAKRSGVPFTIQHSHTTIDAPPTVYHVRSQFKQWELQGYDCEIKYPFPNIKCTLKAQWIFSISVWKNNRFSGK